MLAEGGDANIAVGGHAHVSVVKRDGSSVPFDSDKIRSAVSRAFLSVGETADSGVLDGIVSRVLDRLGGILSPHVETVQDAVERSLMETASYSVAKSYILYRERHRGLRDESAFLLDIDGTMGGYLSQSDWRVHENSNVNFSLGGLILHNSGAVTANYWLNSVYSPEVAAAHRDCAFHIHDLSMLAPYCCGHSLRQLIKEGLGGVPDKLSSSPARHLSTICQQMVNFLGIMQNEWAGAQAFSSFDTYLAPFVKVDRLTDREVKQGLQSFIYGVNTPSRWGSQAPFTNITLDWVCPDDLRDKPAVVGGEEQDFTYGDCQAEMDTINRLFIELMVEGDAVGRGFQYPIPTYNITKDFDWDSPNAALLFGMAGKYGTPYFQNFINSDLNPNDVRSMAFLGGQEFVYQKESGVVSVAKLSNLYKWWVAKGKPDEHIKILMDGRFVPCREMFKIDYASYSSCHCLWLSNGVRQPFSYDHDCLVCRDGEYVKIRVQDVVEGDFLCVSKEPWHLDNGLGTYQAGKVLGYYLAEGWKGDGHRLEFAINIERRDICDELVSFFSSIGCRCRVNEQPDVKIFKVLVSGRQAVGFAEQYVSFNRAIEKRLTSNVWNMSDDFRRGLFDGYLATDGSIQHKHLAHTTNKKLCGDLMTLCSSIGRYVEYRVNENNWRSFNGGERERFTSYKLLLRAPKLSPDGRYWLVRVDKNESVPKSSRLAHVYNFTVDTEEHLVELPNGVVSPQCCRLQLDRRELRRRGGGLFGSDEFTGSIGVVTINLPQLGYLSKDEGEESFFRRLDRLMELAKQSLETKRKVVTRLMERGLYPYTRRYLAHFDNHFSTIGVCGMNECCLNFLGEDITSEQGRAFAVKVLDYMRQRMQDFQEETGNLYNLEATPAESTSYRLAKHDRERYPDIIAGGTDTSPFYTNSTQLPVMYTDDVFEALDLQDPLQTRYTGGTVFHIMLGESVKDWKAVRELVRTVASSYRLPYFSVSPTFSVCPVHGYIDGEHFDCPKCAAERRARLQEKLRALYDERDKLAGEG